MKYDPLEYVLVKDMNSELGYVIYEIENRAFMIIEDFDKAKDVIADLLRNGVEVYENTAAYREKYPPLSAEERKRRGMEFLNEYLRKKDGNK